MAEPCAPPDAPPAGKWWWTGREWVPASTPRARVPARGSRLLVTRYAHGALYVEGDALIVQTRRGERRLPIASAEITRQDDTFLVTPRGTNRGGETLVAAERPEQVLLMARYYGILDGSRGRAEQRVGS
ncbi:MAG: hypothetical protein WAM30_13060 [Candidatus Dormiibacterota bacterium]